MSGGTFSRCPTCGRLIIHGQTCVCSICDADEEATGARCHKERNHDGPHNGWAHYPGQLVSWGGR